MGIYGRKVSWEVYFAWIITTVTFLPKDIHNRNNLPHFVTVVSVTVVKTKHKYLICIIATPWPYLLWVKMYSQLKFWFHRIFIYCDHARYDNKITVTVVKKVKVLKHFFTDLRLLFKLFAFYFVFILTVVCAI